MVVAISNVYHTGSKGTGSAAQTGAPKILLKDVHEMKYLQSDDKSLWYRDGDVYKQIKNCSVKLRNILEFNDSEPHCSITSCNTKTICKTCKILIKETQLTSGLTNKTYHTRSYEDLNCKSSNVVYGVECSLCGLIYVDETKGQLRNKMSGHRYEINHESNQLYYQHFNLPDHSIVSFKVRILKKNIPPYKQSQSEHATS